MLTNSEYFTNLDVGNSTNTRDTLSTGWMSAGRIMTNVNIDHVLPKLPADYGKASDEIKDVITAMQKQIIPT